MGLGVGTLRAFLNGHMGLTQGVPALAEARHACAEWGSGTQDRGFTLQAFLNGRVDLTQVASGDSCL